MRFYCLSNHLAKACYVIEFQGLNIMLDCGLQEEIVLNFLPLPLVLNRKLAQLPNWIPTFDHDPQLDGELKQCSRAQVLIDSAPEFRLPVEHVVSFDQIDVILISNYQSMLALPYITEHTGFNGQIYATEPTLQIGRYFLEELVEYVELAPNPRSSSLWKKIKRENMPKPLNNAFRQEKWRRLYQLPDVKRSLGRVTPVGYDHKLKFNGAVEAMSVSSGYVLGSCNWVISTSYEKICYLSRSSAINTHPRPLNESALKSADVLILSGLTQSPTVHADEKLSEVCVNVAYTIRMNGSALIPCYPSGIVYDLFECISETLEHIGLLNVPMFFISPVAEASLAYSNILSEWLSSTKQDKVYTPANLFPHGDLLKKGKLKHYKHIFSEGFSDEYREPCVVFCGHPSLRFGDVVHFVDIWGSNENNAIIFIEPGFPYKDAMTPFLPISMKTYYCPIDTSLEYAQANKLLKELKPKVLVLPEAYIKPHPKAPNLFIDTTDTKCMSFKCSEILHIPLKNPWVRVLIPEEVTSKVKPVVFSNGASLGTFTAQLEVRDRSYTLKRPFVEDSNAAPSRGQCLSNVNYETGTIDIDVLIRGLTRNGFTNIKREKEGNKVILHLINENTTIHIDENTTHIKCGDTAASRLKVRDTLLECLETF